MAMMRLRREDPRVVGSFRLHRRLGAGGMGVVYLGSDKRGQRVALKVIRPGARRGPGVPVSGSPARCRPPGGSAAAARRGWWPPTWRPSGRGSPPSTCRAPRSTTRWATDGPLPAAEVAAIGAALAEGLVAVHDAGVVHRDLKPSNILLSPKGPRIIDFGIAWATGASTLTHVGTAVGSPGFLAPEQVRGATVTPATDVFAFGATLAYAATADSPFGQGSSEVMLYRVVHEEPDLRGVPDSLAPLVYACLAKEPEDRPEHRAAGGAARGDRGARGARHRLRAARQRPAEGGGAASGAPDRPPCGAVRRAAHRAASVGRRGTVRGPGRRREPPGAHSRTPAGRWPSRRTRCGPVGRDPHPSPAVRGRAARPRGGARAGPQAAAAAADRLRDGDAAGGAGHRAGAGLPGSGARAGPAAGSGAGRPADPHRGRAGGAGRPLRVAAARRGLACRARVG